MRLPTQRELILFLYSTPNMVGSSLGLAGIALFLTGVIHKNWLLIVLSLYATGVMATPRYRYIELQLHNELNREELQQELEALLTNIRDRVPTEIFVQVEEIKTVIIEMLSSINDIEGTDHNLHLIRQTVLDYLPQALEYYLNLPPAFANLHPLNEGKTARVLLEEQLALLNQQMQQIQRELHSHDAAALVTHLHVLQDIFGTAPFFEFVKEP